MKAYLEAMNTQSTMQQQANNSPVEPQNPYDKDYEREEYAIWELEKVKREFSDFKKNVTSQTEQQQKAQQQQQAYNHAITTTKQMLASEQKNDKTISDRMTHIINRERELAGLQTSDVNQMNQIALNKVMGYVMPALSGKADIGDILRNVSQMYGYQESVKGTSSSGPNIEAIERNIKASTSVGSHAGVALTSGNTDLAAAMNKNGRGVDFDKAAKIIANIARQG